MLDPVLQAPDLKLAADSNQVLNYKRDANNYITQLFAEQLPAIRNGFFNAHMSKGFIVQPHWHTNVTEMIFVISGELIASVFDPFTQKLMTYHLKAGQIAVFPQGPGSTGFWPRVNRPISWRSSMRRHRILCMVQTSCGLFPQRSSSAPIASMKRSMPRPWLR